MLEVILAAINWIAGLIVVAEALNKIERMNIRRGVTVSRVIYFAGWFALAVGGGGAIIAPFLREGPPIRLENVLALAGLAAIMLHCRYVQWKMEE